jgi:hypothetical protein
MPNMAGAEENVPGLLDAYRRLLLAFYGLFSSISNSVVYAAGCRLKRTKEFTGWALLKSGYLILVWMPTSLVAIKINVVD